MSSLPRHQKKIASVYYKRLKFMWASPVCLYELSCGGINPVNYLPWNSSGVFSRTPLPYDPENLLEFVVFITIQKLGVEI